MQGQRRSSEMYQKYFTEYRSGKSVPDLSREYGVPTQTLYKKFADMGGKKSEKKTNIKRAPVAAPVTLQLASPTQKNKIVFIIVDRNQAREILDEVL